MPTKYQLQREALKKELDLHKGHVKAYSQATMKDAKQRGKEFLMISGALVGGYFLVSLFTSGKKKKQKNIAQAPAPRFGEDAPQKKKASGLSRALKSYAGSVFMSLATQGIQKLIEELGHKAKDTAQKK